MQRKFLDIIPPDSVEEEEKIEVKTSSNRKFASFGAILLLIIGFSAYFLLGEAKIIIWPKTENLSFQTIVTIDKSSQTVNAGQNIIPGVVFGAEKTVNEEFSSTGKAVTEKKAEGVIRIHNNYSLAQTLVQGTRLQPSLEKFQTPLSRGENPWFKTKEKTIIAPKSYQDVKVMADSSGEKYNIKPSKFSIPGLAGTAQYTLIYGESFQEFQGGMKKEFPLVSAQDLERAKQEVSQKAEDSSLEALQKQVPSEFIFLKDGAKTGAPEILSLARVGQESGKFNYQAKANSFVLAFKKTDLENFAEAFLSSKVPEGKELQKDSLKSSYNVYSSAVENGKMTISLDVEAKIYSSLNETFLKETILRKNFQEAQLFLKGQSNVEKFQIELWPFWVKKVPGNLDKVKIDLILD